MKPIKNISFDYDGNSCAIYINLDNDKLYSLILNEYGINYTPADGDGHAIYWSV